MRGASGGCTSPKGAVDDVAAVAEAEVGHLAWVVTREQTLDEQWFGPSMAPAVRSRLGDVALVAFEPVSFHDPADIGPVRAGVPARIADVGRGERAAGRCVGLMPG